MCQSVTDMKIYDETYFVKATINNSKYTTTDIVWGQSDEGVNAAYKKYNDFKKAFRAGNIIIFLKMTEIFTNGDFGNIRDGIYWCLQQYQNLTNYTQAREKSTRPWIEETSDLYDTQALLAGVMAFGAELMRQILLDKVGQGSTLADYFDPQQKANVPEWDLDYKNRIMTRMLPMLADMKST